MTPDPQHIMLVTGRWVSIRELEQWETYEDLLAGHPTHEGNERQLEGLVQRYRERDGALPYGIEPSEEPIEDVEGWPPVPDARRDLRRPTRLAAATTGSRRGWL